MRRGFTLTELAFVIVIITVIIVLLYPFIGSIRDRAKAISCEENIQKIGRGIRLYAIENEGKFPSSLGELLEGGYLANEKCFDCPLSPHPGRAKDPDYHYVTGYAISSPSDTAIVFDKKENHKGGKYVLYIGGDLEWAAGDGAPL